MATKDEIKSIDRIESRINQMDDTLTVITTQIGALVAASKTSRFWDMLNRMVTGYGNLVMTNNVVKGIAASLWTVILGMLLVGFASRWFDIDAGRSVKHIKELTDISTDLMGPPVPKELESE